MSPLPLEKEWQGIRRLGVLNKQAEMPANEALLRSQAEVGPYEPREHGGEQRWRLIILVDTVAQGPPQSFHVQGGKLVSLFPYSTSWRMRVYCLSLLDLALDLKTWVYMAKSLRSVAKLCKRKAGTSNLCNQKIHSTLAHLSVSLSIYQSSINFSRKKVVSPLLNPFFQHWNRFLNLWSNTKASRWLCSGTIIYGKKRTLNTRILPSLSRELCYESLTEGTAGFCLLSHANPGSNAKWWNVMP